MGALFFDIDDTLLSGVTKKVPESALEGIRKVKENGHKVLINTGRTICSVPPIIKKLDVDGFLCGCGTYLIYKNEVLFESHISIEEGNRYIDLMKEYHIEGFLEGTDDMYFSERVSQCEPVESTRRYMASMGLGRETSMEKKNFEYDKLLIHINKKDPNCRYQEFFASIEDGIDIIDRLNGMYELVQKGYSKATAIEFMRQHLGLTKDEVYVFGDSSNDQSMFEYAKHSIAMKKHDPVLDPYTEYVTNTVENDGVYKAMQHYGLI